MPDDRRFSEEDLESNLRDLGARVEYPSTPDVARAVRLRLDRESDQETRRSWRLPPFLTPRWTAAAAALALVCVIALSPAVRTTLADFLVPGDGATQEAGRSAAGQETGVASQATSPPATDEGKGATGCPYPAIEAEPARGVAGTKFRLGGHNFSSGCDSTRIGPAHGVRIYFLQSGKTWKLETIDADRDLTIETGLMVPSGAEPGPATVRATTRYGEAVEDHFVVLR